MPANLALSVSQRLLPMWSYRASFLKETVQHLGLFCLTKSLYWMHRVENNKDVLTWLWLRHFPKCSSLIFRHFVSHECAQISVYELFCLTIHECVQSDGWFSRPWKKNVHLRGISFKLTLNNLWIGVQLIHFHFCAKSWLVFGKECDVPLLGLVYKALPRMFVQAGRAAVSAHNAKLFWIAE